MSSRRAWAIVKSVGLGALVLSGHLMVTVTGEAGILDASWVAPTTNTDGSPLTDLGSYRLYYATAASPCPGSPYVQMISPTPSPSPGQTISYRLAGLATGSTYYVSMTAVDTNGNQSPCSSIASGVARSDFAVNPTGTVNFGSVNLGGSADQMFTVSNTGGGAISGSASVALPFSVVSGSPFTLAGAGATATVTVRFAPTTTASVSANLTFTASGGTYSAIVTGSGIGTPGDTTPPTAAVTTPAAGTTVTGTVTVTGTATDNVGVVGVQFKLDGAPLGAEVMTPPYAVTWNTTTTSAGDHILTAMARDAAGNVTTSAGITVRVGATSGPTDVTAPTISKASLSVTASGATIGWKTNEASDTQVDWGPTQSCGNLAPLNTSLVTSHSQTISGLAPNTWYFFKMRSRDAAGNLAVSTSYKFKTRVR